MADIITLDPPIDPTEQGAVAFDFGLMSVTISTVISMTCSVVSGTDPTPQSRVIGAPQVATSPTTQAPASAVFQLFGNMLDGVVYGLSCVALTTDGQHVAGDALLQCRNPFP